MRKGRDSETQAMESQLQIIITVSLSLILSGQGRQTGDRRDKISSLEEDLETRSVT